MVSLFRVGFTLGNLFSKLAGDANDLEKALEELGTKKPAKPKPTNVRDGKSQGTDAVGDQVIWGPEVAVDSRNDLSTWGGYDSVSRY